MSILYRLAQLFINLDFWSDFIRNFSVSVNSTKLISYTIAQNELSFYIRSCHKPKSYISRNFARNK